MILETLETPHFGAFLLQKEGWRKYIQVKPTTSKAQLSACFLCSHANPLFLLLTTPIHGNRSRLSCSGNFRLFNLILTWSPLENSFKKQNPIWGVHPNTKSWLVRNCLSFASPTIYNFICLWILKVLMYFWRESVVSQILAIPCSQIV